MAGTTHIREVPQDPARTGSSSATLGCGRLVRQETARCRLPLGQLLTGNLESRLHPNYPCMSAHGFHGVRLKTTRPLTSHRTCAAACFVGRARLEPTT